MFIAIPMSSTLHFAYKVKDSGLHFHCRRLDLTRVSSTMAECFEFPKEPLKFYFPPNLMKDTSVRL